MKFSNWKNQYIEATESKPDYILPLDSKTVTKEQVQTFQKKMLEYDHTYCEVGSGSGGHLIEQAKNNPQNLYIGFELRFKRTFRTAEKAEKYGIKNLYVVRGDALLVEPLLAGMKLDGIFVNFPDPWSKKKWKKHRILSLENLKLFSELLKSSGSIYYKTDHQEYFHETAKLIKDSSFLKINWLTEDLWQSEFAESNIATEFEMLFRSKEMPIYALNASKIN